MCPMHVSKTGVVEPKPVNIWNKEERHLSNGLHLLINSFNIEDSTFINMLMTIKEAWVFLEKKYSRCTSYISISYFEKIENVTTEWSIFMASYSEDVPSSYSYWTDTSESEQFYLQDSYDQLVCNNLKFKTVMTKIHSNIV